MLTGSAVWALNVRCKLLPSLRYAVSHAYGVAMSVIGKDMGDPEGLIRNFFRWLSALLVRE